MTLRDKLLFQIDIVFDDAVVDDYDLVLAAGMWMGVYFEQASVRRPSRMAQSDHTHDRLLLKDAFQNRKFSRTSPQLDPAAVKNGDPGGVVSAVFQPF